MSPVKPWTRHFFEALQSGEPQTYAKVLVEAAAFVPPGRAYREAERHRESRRTKDGVTTPRVKAYNSATLIREGSRSIVRASLRIAIRNGRITEYYEGGVRMLRLGPRPWEGD